MSIGYLTGVEARDRGLWSFDKREAPSVQSSVYFRGGAGLVTAKQEVESLLAKLPDDCSLEDIQYHLYVIEKVRLGLDKADKEGAISQDEAERRLDKWLTK
jgi:hypothetical protein